MDTKSPVIDSHAHAFPDTIAAEAMKKLVAEAKWFPVRNYHDGTTRGLLVSMDRAGITRAIVCSVATRPTQVKKITDWSAAIKSERLIPFASIHPDYEKPEEEVERIAQAGIRGLKFHPQYMNCPADDPRVLRIIRAAAEANLAVVFHAGHDLAFERNDIASPRRLRNVYEAVPGVRLMTCHMGGWECWEESLECLAGLPIWMETSFCLGQCPQAMLQRLMEKHGPKYLLWGSDSPWMDQKEDLEKLKAMNLPASLLKGMLWENVKRFLGE